MVCHLKFRNGHLMADFIQDNNIQEVATFSRTNTLIGSLEMDFIDLAFEKYGALENKHQSNAAEKS